MATMIDVNLVQQDVRTVCSGHTEAIMALKQIAQHYEGCYIRNDDSATWIVKRACRVLGWSMAVDSSEQLKLVKPLGTSW